MADRRSDLRFEIVGRLRGTLAVEEAVHVLNVSSGGALIEVPWSPPMDTHYAVRLMSHQHVACTDARVRHVRRAQVGDGFLVGIEFLPTETGLADLDGVLGAGQAPDGGTERA